MATLNLINGTVTYGDGTTQSSAGFAWTYISGKPTTLSGYGITDTLLKTVTYPSVGGDGAGAPHYVFAYGSALPIYQSGTSVAVNCYNTNCNCQC